MSLHRRTLLAAALACGVHARAQALPRRIICASPPGGPPDLIARAFAQGLDAATIVDNRPGAGGLIAVGVLQRARPDGTALLLAHSGLLTTNRFVYTQLPYDPALDLLPVSLAAELSMGFAVGPSAPTRRLEDFVAWAKAKRGGINYGSPGVATLPHLLGATLARKAGFEGQHIPYPGGPPAMADLASGGLDAVILPEGLLRPLHLSGRIRVLAIFDKQRSAALPEVPTLAESGYELPPGREWFGFFAPRGTPAELISETARALSAALSPAMAAGLAEAGIRALTSRPVQLNARITNESDSWRDLVVSSGISLT